MNILSRVYLRLRRLDGQTMSEYVLIVAAVAALAFGAYRIMGQDLQQMVNSVGNSF